MVKLVEKKCVPCEGGVKSFTETQINEYLPQISAEWQIKDFKKIERVFVFKNFSEAIKFVNLVAEIAEDQGHHPDIEIHYNRVGIKLWTHAIKGLHENDFIMASKIEKLV